MRAAHGGGWEGAAWSSGPGRVLRCDSSGGPLTCRELGHLPKGSAPERAGAQLALQALSPASLSGTPRFADQVPASPLAHACPEPHTARRSSRPAPQQEPELQLPARSVSWCLRGLSAEEPAGPSSPGGPSRRGPWLPRQTGCVGGSWWWGARLGSRRDGRGYPHLQSLPLFPVRPLPGIEEQGLSPAKVRGQGRGSRARAPGHRAAPGRP